MFNFLFVMLMSGCMTNKRMLTHAKRDLNNYNCLKQIERKFEDNQCFRLEVYKDGVQVVFRCRKPDMKRRNLWDKWWFRITSPTMRLPPELILQIEAHTICLDSEIRLEAYPPKEEEE